MQIDFEKTAQTVIAAKSGDGEAMNRLLNESNDLIYYNCLKMLKNPEDALDCTQEILITIYQKLNTLNDPRSYTKWVKLITVNRCKNVLSKSGREVLLDEGKDGEDPFAAYEDTDEQAVPDKAIDNKETERMIMELVDALPAAQRMCTIMYYYDEMSVKEIAEAMGVSEGTIKSRLNYSRKQIKEGVLKYEKQGVKLYGLSVIPFLVYFLRKNAEASALPAVQTAAMTVTATGATVGTAVATGTASAVTMTGATATASTAATVAASVGIGTKILKVAAIVAACVIACGGLLGGATFIYGKILDDRYSGYSHSIRDEEPNPGKKDISETAVQESEEEASVSEAILNDNENIEPETTKRKVAPQKRTSTGVYYTITTMTDEENEEMFARMAEAEEARKNKWREDAYENIDDWDFTDGLGLVEDDDYELPYVEWNTNTGYTIHVNEKDLENP